MQQRRYSCTRCLFTATSSPVQRMWWDVSPTWRPIIFSQFVYGVLAVSCTLKFSIKCQYWWAQRGFTMQQHGPIRNKSLFPPPTGPKCLVRGSRSLPWNTRVSDSITVNILCKTNVCPNLIYFLFCTFTKGKKILLHYLKLISDCPADYRGRKSVSATTSPTCKVVFFLISTLFKILLTLNKWSYLMTLMKAGN